MLFLTSVCFHVRQFVFSTIVFAVLKNPQASWTCEKDCVGWTLPAIAACNARTLLLVPTLAPRFECAQLPALLSTLDRWCRPWRRSLSRDGSALCRAPPLLTRY